MQGLILLSRHDVTLFSSIEHTGIFDTWFSTNAKRAAYIILAEADQVARLTTYIHNKKPLAREEQTRLRRKIKSLETAIEINSSSASRESFLTAIALSIKIFLQMTLQHTMDTKEELGDSVVQLMEVLQKPEQQVPSSLALCATLETRFWYTIMGAIAASESGIKSFYTSRLKRISIALAFKSWRDVESTLGTFFWVPSIFSAPCRQAMSEVMDWKECADS
ncbi:hypothetical protein H2204_001589 [Knufia peltigerae]|uniref:Uncharacterized protein n=1 Tax=Knufia peltigerae TaxID=1002370 RepID=A0AA38YCK0_9EURO|nr:hypothetical protein H2204_001589 [Knufia peltigerae]